MPSRTPSTDPLITRAEIARLAEVSRPTVTAWGRAPDFPVPERAGGEELFRQAVVLAWLDARRIPQRYRKATEPEEATFGYRVRQALLRGGASRAVDSAVPAAPVTAESQFCSDQRDALDRARVRELMGALADRVRGAGSVVDYMNLLLSLHFLRLAGREEWDEVLWQAQGGTGADGVGKLLLHIGSVVDERLKRLGARPGMQEALVRLEPRKYEDLQNVVRRVGELGRGAFRFILDEYEMRARLRSEEFFTPRGVARVMAELARGEGSGGSVYDPYARGGELLTGAVNVHGAEGIQVSGFSNAHDTARLASMNLALHGARSIVQLTRGAPWNSKTTSPRRFTWVLCNPPFNMSDSADAEQRAGTWPYGAPPVGNDNFAWVQHALVSLEEGGTAAVVMPVKAGNSANAAEIKIRSTMVDRGVVQGVIALPDRLFSSTSVPVSVWLLGHPDTPCEAVRFVDARSLGTMRGSKRVLNKEDVRAILDAYRAADPGGATAPDASLPFTHASRRTLRERGCSLSPLDHLGARQDDPVAVMKAFTGAWQDMQRAKRELESADAAVSIVEDGHPDVLARAGGWVALSQLCEIQAGPSYTRLPTRRRTPEGPVPLVFPKHLHDGHIEHPGDLGVHEELAARLHNFRLEPGDLVCVRTGAIGQPALVSDGQAGWLMSTNLLRLRPLEEAPVDPEYLAYYLRRSEAVTWVVDRAAATAAPTISAAALGHQPVLLPPLKEQRRIAEQLAALEEQAAAHRRFADTVSASREALAEFLMGAPARAN